MSKFVRNISKSFKYYNLEGLVCYETPQTYIVTWSRLRNPKDVFKGTVVY